MSSEFLLEVLFLKIKVKGYLENKTNKTKEIIDTYGIKKENQITYVHNDTKNILNIAPDSLTLTRTNSEYSHQIKFIKDKEVDTEYYLPNENISLYINILTKEINILDNSYKVTYLVTDSNQEFTYYIEESDNK